MPMLLALPRDDSWQAGEPTGRKATVHSRFFFRFNIPRCFHFCVGELPFPNPPVD